MNLMKIRFFKFFVQNCITAQCTQDITTFELLLKISGYICIGVCVCIKA